MYIHVRCGTNKNGFTKLCSVIKQFRGESPNLAMEYGEQGSEDRDYRQNQSHLSKVLKQNKALQRPFSLVTLNLTRQQDYLDSKYVIPSSPTKKVSEVCSITLRATEMAVFTRLRHPTAPTSCVTLK